MTELTPEELEALRHIHKLVIGNAAELYKPQSLSALHVSILGDYLNRQHPNTAQKPVDPERIPGLLAPRRSITILDAEFPILADAYALIFALSEDLNPMPARYARALGFMQSLCRRFAQGKHDPKWIPPDIPTKMH